MYEELVKRLRDSEHEIDCSLCDRDCCYSDGKVHDKCIIIEAADAIEELQKRVPKKPHGRLIDADALSKSFEKTANYYYEHGSEVSSSFWSGGEICTEWYAVEDLLENAPTVIPASKEGETDERRV